MANVSVNTTKTKRNTNLAKWKILFERGTSQWISFKPQEGLEVYPCYACRDMFGSKTSFLDHVNRRGILLVYQCPNCSKEPLIFYNPCALLLHARQHFSFYSGQINLENIDVFIVPLGMAGFLPHPDVPMIYDVIEDDIDNTFSNVNTKFYNPLLQNMGQQIVNMVPTVLLFHHSGNPPTSMVLKQISSNIPRCKFILLERSLIQNSNVLNRDIEQSVLQSPCSNTTNILDKIMKEEPPDIDSNVTDSANMSRTKDEAPETTQANSCLECGKKQTTTMSIHFTNNNNQPLNENLRCAICKYIAPSKCSLQAHIRIHEGSPPFVCPECGNCFQSYEELFDHSDDVCFHLAKQVRFRCPKKNCCKVFAQTTTFFSHFDAHILTYTKCLICDSLFNAMSDFLEHTKEMHGNAVLSKLIYKCTICKNGGPPFTEETYKSHIKWHCSNRELSVYVYVCKFCRNFFRSTVTYATHLLRCSRKDLVGEDLRRMKRSSTATICDKCNYIIRIITTIPKCPKCGERLNTPYTIKANFNIVSLESSPHSCILCSKLKHVEGKEHKCKYTNPVVVLKKNYENDEVEVESPKSDDSLKRKRKRQTTPTSSKKKFNISSLESVTESQLDKPLPFDGTYHCKLCEYTSQDRHVFHDHIIRHRDISTAYQCMECGECFVVKPSLQKHLLYYHQVSNIDVYMTNNMCFDKSAVSELKEITNLAPGESKLPVAENQCRVCLQQFQDALELNKHFRIHGMAFLLKNSK